MKIIQTYRPRRTAREWKEILLMQGCVSLAVIIISTVGVVTVVDGVSL